MYTRPAIAHSKKLDVAARIRATVAADSNRAVPGRDRQAQPLRRAPARQPPQVRQEAHRRRRIEVPPVQQLRVKEVEQQAKVIAVSAYGVGAVTRIGQVAEKPGRRPGHVACLVEEQDPADDPAVTSP